MVRLIEANALKKTLEMWANVPDYNEAERHIIRAAIVAVEDCPTIDAAPVVHARWIPVDVDNAYFICSLCKDKTTKWRIAFPMEILNSFNYCPHCGAKMDGGEANEHEPG